MASFSTSTAPDSLDNVLDSLQMLLHHQQQPQHILYDPHAPHYALQEPFSHQHAEQYDDPLVLDDTVRPRSIPVLRNVIRHKPLDDTEQAHRHSDMDITLKKLHAELTELVSDIMTDAREHLQGQDLDNQDIMETSLKHFLHDLTARLPR